MKRRLMLVAVIGAIVAALFALNQWKPARLNAATIEKSAQVAERLAEIDKEVAESVALAQADSQPAPEPPAAPEPAAPPAAVAPPAAAQPKEEMPNVFKVRVETSKGPIVIEVHKDWAPNGAKRFYELVKMGFYNDNRFFRVVTKPRPFVVQWGIPGDPKLAKEWWNKTIPDDKPKKSNEVGTVTFAAGQMPDSRTTQLFINLSANKFLDGMGFAPFGMVVEGMEVVKQFNSQYQEDVTGKQGDIVEKGNTWLDEAFPGLDYIKSMTIVE